MNLSIISVKIVNSKKVRSDPKASYMYGKYIISVLYFTPFFADSLGELKIVSRWLRSLPLCPNSMKY